MPNSRAQLPHSGRLKKKLAAVAGLGLAMTLSALGPAAADKLKHPVAVFSGLDKITGRIITFEVGANETVQFGSLQITERVCYSRPPTETPQTDTFVEIDNIDANNDYKRVFTGWMFAGSPSLHALDHPVYDIWLLRCKGDGQLIPSPPDDTQTEAPLQPQQPQQAVQPQTQDLTKTVQPQTKQIAPTGDQQAPSGGGPIDVAPPPGFAQPDQNQQQPNDQDQQPVDQNQQGTDQNQQQPTGQNNGGFFTSPSPPPPPPGSGNGNGNGF